MQKIDIVWVCLLMLVDGFKYAKAFEQIYMTFSLHIIMVKQT